MLIFPPAVSDLLASLRRAVKMALERRNCRTALTRLPWQTCLKLSDIANRSSLYDMHHLYGTIPTARPPQASSLFAYANRSGLYDMHHLYGAIPRRLLLFTVKEIPAEQLARARADGEIVFYRLK